MRRVFSAVSKKSVTLFRKEVAWGKVGIGTSSSLKSKALRTCRDIRWRHPKEREDEAEEELVEVKRPAAAGCEVAGAVGDDRSQ